VIGDIVHACNSGWLSMACFDIGIALAAIQLSAASVGKTGVCSGERSAASRRDFRHHSDNKQQLTVRDAREQLTVCREEIGKLALKFGSGNRSSF
jgi:hypothetical protein